MLLLPRTRVWLAAADKRFPGWHGNACRAGGTARVRDWSHGRPSLGSVIKYLGAKRALVLVLGDIAERRASRTAVDLFTGTTRVAQELKRRGLEVTAVDL